MKKTISIVMIVCVLLSLLFSNSCALYYGSKAKAELGAKIMGTQRQKQILDGDLDNDAENGYEKTKAFLVSLSIPEETVSTYNDSQLDYFARSNSVAAFSTEGQDCEPQMSLVMAMHDNGRIRIYADVEWSRLPKERYTDFLSVSGLPQILTLYENESLTVSLNGEEKTLSQESDYELYIKDIGQVGIKLELGKILKNAKSDDESVKFHFEIDVINAAPTEYNCFNAYMFYQHLNTKHDGITKVGRYNDLLGFEFNKYSRIQLTYYLLSPHYPLSYYPKGFIPKN